MGRRGCYMHSAEQRISGSRSTDRSACRGPTMKSEVLISTEGWIFGRVDRRESPFMPPRTDLSRAFVYRAVGTDTRSISITPRAAEPFTVTFSDSRMIFRPRCGGNSTVGSPSNSPYSPIRSRFPSSADNSSDTPAIPAQVAVRTCTSRYVTPRMTSP